MPKFVTQPGLKPTAKVSAATLAAFASPFFVDLVTLWWPAIPATFEPFMYALLVFTAGWLVPEINTPKKGGT